MTCSLNLPKDLVKIDVINSISKMRQLRVCEWLFSGYLTSPKGLNLTCNSSLLNPSPLLFLLPLSCLSRVISHFRSAMGPKQ